MQFSLFATVIVIAVSAVKADRTVLVLLNKGVVSTTSGSCSDSEFSKVQAIITKSSLNSTYTRRQLRTTVDVDDMTESMMMQPKEHRALWASNCKKLCEGFEPRTCTEVGCKGYRRHLLSGEQDDRDLLSAASFTCTQQVDYINTELNKLATHATLVSANCKTLISKPRNITCFDDVIYGPNGYYEETGEYNRPYSAFGDSFSSNGRFFGVKLPYLGQYTLTALPDGLIEKKKVLTFNVVPGTVTAVKLWDITANTVLNANFTGGNICNSKTVNFEAVMPLADKSKITLTSTNGYSESSVEASSPYSIFNNDANGILQGKKLSNGAYTLTIYPDEVVSNKVRTVTFNVVSC